ncbi:ACP S-malonyltransferase [Candidatus Fermentibacterales bacterium]|nr:ACP S-malonyltransferase [Candidatus Fermentibacterales bacterium]
MSGTAFVFPGQGSQSVGMDRHLRGFPAAAELLDRTDELTGVEGLAEMISAGPIEDLTRTDRVQPAITIVSLAALAVLGSHGIRPTVVAGHSLGEYSALVAAGALRREDALLLVRHRGRLMQECADRHPGGMAALIGADREAAERVVSEASEAGAIGIANINSNGQVVISGCSEAIDLAGKLAAEAGIRRFIPLRVSGAWHSPLMSEAAAGLRSYLDRVEFRDPSLEVVANVTASRIASGAESRDLLERQVTSPVLWSDSIRSMVESGIDHFVEVGPGKVLQGLFRDYPGVRVSGTESLEAITGLVRES